MRLSRLIPLLCVLHPVIFVFAGEGKWLPPEDFVAPAMILALLGILTCLFLWTLSKRPFAASLATGGGFVVLFAYQDFSRWTSGIPKQWLFGALALVGAAITFAQSMRQVRWQLALGVGAAMWLSALLLSKTLDPRSIPALGWILVVILAMAAVLRWDPHDGWIGASTAATVGLLVVPAVGIIQVQIGIYRARAEMPTHSIVKPTDTARKGDIVVVILDGYGRADMLDKVFGLDNRLFVDSLQSRGFSVAAGSTSNYAQTEQSVASFLNGVYLDQLMPKSFATSRNRVPMRDLINDSRLEQVAKAQGFRFEAISTGFHAFEPGGEESNVSSVLPLASSLVMNRSPEGALMFTRRTEHAAHRNAIRSAMTALSRVKDPGPPTVTVAHLLSPHPPFVFRRDGSSIDPPRPFGLWDCQYFSLKVGSKLEYLGGYSQQLEYLNTAILATVDQIRSHRGPDTIIVLVGDHGSRMGHHLSKLELADVRESFSNLIAVAGPSAFTSRIRQDASNVNLGRALIEWIAGQEQDQLPDRCLYATWDFPYQTQDVTDKVRVGKQGLEP